MISPTFWAVFESQKYVEHFCGWVSGHHVFEVQVTVLDGCSAGQWLLSRSLNPKTCSLTPNPQPVLLAPYALMSETGAARTDPRILSPTA